MTIFDKKYVNMSWFVFGYVCNKNYQIFKHNNFFDKNYFNMVSICV